MTKFDPSNADPLEYAEEFMRLFGKNKKAIDADLMLGWFGNAMCWAKDNGRDQKLRSYTGKQKS